MPQRGFFAMARLIKTRSKKKGLPPGTLVHIGEKRAQGASIAIIDYDEANLSELEVKTLDQCFPFKESPTTTWINVGGLDADVIQKLGDCYGLHPLVLEDVLNTDQRPKMEDYGEYIYIVAKMLGERKERKGVEFFSEQISIILGKNFVILEAVGERIEDIEDELVSRPAPHTLKNIHELKREMIYLRKSVWPLREVVSWLERGGSPLLKGTTGIFFRG